MALYKGFSTIGNRDKWTLSDAELIKRDLLNHFHTRQGERVMNPNFGSIIYDLTFEPLTEATREELEEDVRRIIDLDPRVSLRSIGINEFQYGIQIVLDIQYVSDDLSETLFLNFDTVNSGFVDI